MSTSVTQVNLSSSWKQEVNRRVAAHMNRKAPFAAERGAEPESRPDPGSRAAQAAARVAARYAKAPSYSEMLAGEARTAIQAAEAASRAAREAQAAAQSVLDSLEAAGSIGREPDDRYRAAGTLHAFPEETTSEFELESAVMRRENVIDPPAFPAFEAQAGAAGFIQTLEDQPFAIRWEPDLPQRRTESVAIRSTHAADLFGSDIRDWPEPGPADAEAREFEMAGEMVEPAQPIFANLIEFPRELVATRKVRPRLVEGPFAAEEPGSQLSIFEVEPGAISIEPEPAQMAMETSAPAWTGPEWSGISLDAQPEQGPAQDTLEAQKASALELAPLSRRLLAVLVDAALVAGTILAAAILAATKTAELPSPHTIEFGSALALLAAGALYQWLFLTRATATPGMWYAQIRLCTLEGHAPTIRQRNARLIALLVSILPLGLGIGWAIFDDDHLTWHDRLSRTYPRRY